MIYKPHSYQSYAIQHLLDNPAAALWLSVGLGKSSITLTAVEWLLGTLAIDKVLIVAPKRVVAHTWPSELRKWDNLKHLKISVIQGNEKQRIQALYTKADIYAISRDLIAWLVHYIGKNKGKWPFDMLVVDESSNYKNPSAQRFKALKRILPYCRRTVILSGTPSPNGLLGLWSQIYLLDKGERLGRTYGAYKEEFFVAGAQNGHIVFNYYLKKDAERKIFEKISDIALSMDKKDHLLDLPPRYDIYQEVELQSYKRYEQFKKNEVLILKDGFELTPVNAASMYGKLLQYCNGAVYRGDGSYEIVDNSKLEELQEDVEALDGDPVFIVYQFQSDYERFLKAFPGIVKIQSDQQIDDWNAGFIPIACSQIQSLAYGVNLQESGNHLYHFGLGWDLELYQQFCGRLDRMGKKKATINKHFVAKGSIEQLVIERLAGKYDTQEKLMLALKRYFM